MDSITLDILRMKQPIGMVYISKVNAYDLYTMAQADIVKFSNESQTYDGIQREINPEKVLFIKDYLTSRDATFPNSIILNINKDKIIEQNDNKITIKKSPDTFSIIDGQHRLKGFENSQGIDFDLSISFFISLEPEEQSRVFVTINSEQTKVNSSLSFYQESKEKHHTPRKIVADLSIMFAKDLESPWKNKIKLLGKKDDLSEEGIISLSAFAQPIVNYIYNDRKFFNKLRNVIMENNNNLSKISSSENFGQSILWDFYVSGNEASIYKILLNYFNAFKDIFSNDWKDKNSLLTKTTGYNAIIKLFEEIYNIGYQKDTLTYTFFYESLQKLNILDMYIHSKNYGTSGDKASNDLYKDFKTILASQNLDRKLLPYN